jgi:hypothetical protein
VAVRLNGPDDGRVGRSGFLDRASFVVVIDDGGSGSLRTAAPARGMEVVRLKGWGEIEAGDEE